MTRCLLTAAAIGTLTGVALSFGPHGAIGVAVCAAGVLAWYLVRSVRRDRMRRYRKQVWHRRMADLYGPQYLALRNDVQDRLFDGIPELLNDLDPWPIGDDERRS